MNTKTYLWGWKPAGRPYLEQTKDLLVARNKGFIKLVELLHIQLMRKGRYRYYGLYNHPVYGQVYSIAKYDIKSGSSAPYDYHSPYNLGLNQFFVGQNPYAWYQGDPGSSSGIYHDTCEIIRSQDNATSTIYGLKDLSVIKAWGQGEMVHSLHPVFNPFKDREYIYRFPVKAKISCTFEWDKIVYITNNFKEILDENGNKIIDKSQSTIKVIRNVNVDMERWRINLDGSRQRLADIRDLNFNTTLQATPIYGYKQVDGVKDKIITGYNKDIDIFAYLPVFYRELKDSRVYTYDEMTKLIGQTLEWELVLNGDDDFVDIYLWGKYAGRIIAFGDGEVAGYMDDGRILIQGTKLEQHSFTTGSDNEHTHYFYYEVPTLNLIETFDPNTHMPLRGAFKFVTQWQSHYGLFVEEDKETWEKLVPIVAIVIVIVVTIVTYGVGTAYTTGVTSGFYGATASGLAAVGVTGYAATFALSGALLMGAGYGLSYMGVKHDKQALIAGGKILSLAGSVISIASMVSSVWSEIILQSASNTSLLSASSVANSSGLSQTSVLYANTGFSNASALGSNLTTSSEIMLGSGGNLTGGLYAAGDTTLSSLTMTAISQPVGLTTTQIINQSLDLLSTAYKTYSDARDIFKKPNEFSDDEIPTNDDKPQINYLPMNSEYIMRRHYNISDDYDLGLEPGTLLYIPSVKKN
ncbi:hypothetical protein [Campylobacter devanensis]|uniref:hypothetical protein n=1 Tax=Campylobacter devanensis TaxID=3161138 RepID=UPI000A33EB93|nr:hypothetical protein [Campylobacter sp. P0087]